MTVVVANRAYHPAARPPHSVMAFTCWLMNSILSGVTCLMRCKDLVDYLVMPRKHPHVMWCLLEAWAEALVSHPLQTMAISSLVVYMARGWRKIQGGRRWMHAHSHAAPFWTSAPIGMAIAVRYCPVYSHCGMFARHKISIDFSGASETRGPLSSPTTGSTLCCCKHQPDVFTIQWSPKCLACKLDIAMNSCAFAGRTGQETL